MKLFLFTNSFPYDDQYTEIPFLQNEIPFLEKAFKIQLIPLRNSGNIVGLSDRITVNNSFSEYFWRNKRKNIFFKTFVSFRYKYFYTEIRRCKSIKQVYNLILRTHQIMMVYRWAVLNKKLFDTNINTLFYTYWNTDITLGLEYLIEKEKLPFKIISRAHGADLYLERSKYNPYYKLRLKKLDKLFLVSEAGKNYLENKFPEYKEKFRLSYLGTKNKNKTIRTKTKDIITIASCSSIIELKRVDVIYKSVYLFALKNKGRQIKWIHFGGGQGELSLRELITNNDFHNLTIEIKGIIPNNKILNYYDNNFVDCFVHASKTEGLPVSFMEAQSYGIPIISTNVGGIPEIVKPENGILVNSKADPNEISDAIEKIVLNEDYRKKHSESARKNWESNFNANNNYRKFAQYLKTLLQ